jgi:ribosomal protein S18 acetylase RimI-like enzyme
MKNKVLVRRVNPRDRDRLYKLWDEFGRVYTKKKLTKPLGLTWTEEYLDESAIISETTDEFISDPKHICFVAELENNLIGFISGCLNINEKKIYARKGYIEDWFVSENYRNQGVGKKLYNELIKEFAKEKCDNLEIHAYVSNPAIEMYRKLGFQDMVLKMIKKFDYEKEVEK